MRPAYELKKDLDTISKVQNATLTTEEFGIEQTHGLFGSKEWWEQISSGRLPLHTLRGVIVERFWGSMADWPEIKVRDDDGNISRWTRRVNVREQDALYIPGQKIEIDYVLQRHRPKSFDRGAETKQVTEVRVEPSAEMAMPGRYEKLCARELAEAVCLNYMLIIDISHHLSELGNTPGIMDSDAQRVFTSVASEVEGVIAQNRYVGMDALLTRWKSPVLAACKRILEFKS